MNDQEWLDQLKAGDQVIVDSTWYGDTLATVDRVAKTQIVAGPYRFSKQGGWELGGSRGQVQLLVQPTPERSEKVKRKTLMNSIVFVKRSQIKNATVEQLEAAWAAVKACIDAQPDTVDI